MSDSIDSLAMRANPQLFQRPFRPPYQESLPLKELDVPGGWHNGWGASETLPDSTEFRDSMGQWAKVCRHILGWYHDPDLEALRMASAIALSHYAPHEKATWSFIIGESGSGKTDLCIKALSGLPKKRILDQISSKSFLSGMGNGENSLLRRSGHGELWLFKDFTTILSEGEDERKRIIGILRSVWDGECKRETGSAARQIDWTGKMTCLIACTPALERHWGVYREMGERFMVIRWREPKDIRQTLRCLAYHRGHEEEISKSLKRLMAQWITTDKVKWGLIPNPAGDDRLISLAILVAHLRVNPSRDHDHKIRDIPKPEFPSRLITGARAVRDYHARLFQKPTPDKADIRLAERILWNTIPPKRLDLLKVLPMEGTMSVQDLRQALSYPKSTFNEFVENLEAQELLDRTKRGDETQYTVSWTSKAKDLLKPLLEKAAPAEIPEISLPDRIQ